MTVTVRESDFHLEPMEIEWGEAEKTKITTVADSSGDLGATYFLLNTPDVSYYVWINTGSDSDPAVSGKTGIEVTISTDDDAEAVRDAIKTALDSVTYDSLPEFLATNGDGTDELIVENSRLGKVDQTEDGAGGSETGFTFDQEQASLGRVLGATSGGIEVTPEAGMLDVTADQLGEQVIEQINTSSNISLSMTLQEMSAENWKLILGEAVGATYTPGTGTEVVGFGESKRFSNMTPYSHPMRLRPINAADNTRNHTFWKVYPVMDSINFSGTELETMSVTFRAFRDTTKAKEINLFVFGDHLQDFSAS